MPAPTPDQQKLVKLVNKFRGISQYRSITQVPMDNALDLVNVMVSTIGNLEKMRVPVIISPGNPVINGVIQRYIDSMFMFTQGNGTRQLFFNSGGGLGYYTDPETGAPLIFTLVANTGYASRTRYVSSNNLLFGANGSVVWKWTGTLLLFWGLPQPPAPPQLGIQYPITSIRQTGTTITVDWNTSGSAELGGSTVLLNPGDMVAISGTNPLNNLNGNFAVATAPSAGVATLTSSIMQTVGPFPNTGFITIYSTPAANKGTNTYFTIQQVRRVGGISIITLSANDAMIGLNPDESVTIAGLTGALTSFNGYWTDVFVGGTYAPSFTFPQLAPDVPTTNANAGATAAGGFSNAVGPRTWRYSWAISATGEEGPASDASQYVPNSAQGLAVNIRGLLVIPSPPPGYGIDSFFLYANQDGGGTWVTVPGPGLNGVDECWPTPALGGPTFVSDGYSDDLLDPSFQANFINYPPPQDMAYVQKFQGRIFGAGMPEDPQAVVYSGFDQIYRGRPESSWPPLNRIELAIGADRVRGFGVLLNGVVIWDESNKMYMFSGTIQDITTTQPVQIADLLEEEPWQTGLASADSVQSTPRGLVWVGADMTVQIWNGIFYGEIIGPRDLTQNFYPYMSRITPSWRPLIQSGYFNWLERDWYVISVALDGATTPTHMFFFDLSQEGADNLGIWVMNIPHDSIAIKVTSNGTRTLVASINGVVNALHISSTSTNGIHNAPTSTTAVLDAFWDSGYWQDEPHTTKMFRYGRLTCDQSGFQLITTVLNDESIRFSTPNPRTFNLKLTPGGRFATNRKGRRQKFRIIFPRQDVDASVVELYTTAIPLADI